MLRRTEICVVLLTHVADLDIIIFAKAKISSLSLLK